MKERSKEKKCGSLLAVPKHPSFLFQVTWFKNHLHIQVFNLQLKFPEKITPSAKRVAVKYLLSCPPPNQGTTHQTWVLQWYECVFIPFNSSQHYKITGERRMRTFPCLKCLWNTNLQVCHIQSNPFQLKSTHAHLRRHLCNGKLCLTSRIFPLLPSLRIFQLKLTGIS